MTRILYVPVPESDRVELAEDYQFWVDGLEIWIPRGFQWNGASIPQFLWSLVGGRYEPDTLQASLEHDWIYLFHGAGRRQADALFLQRLKEAGMPRWKSTALYQAVRVFGASHWPTSAADRHAIAEIRQMLTIREDQDKFTRSMLVAG